MQVISVGSGQKKKRSYNLQMYKKMHAQNQKNGKKVFAKKTWTKFWNVQTGQADKNNILSHHPEKKKKNFFKMDSFFEEII